MIDHSSVPLIAAIAVFIAFVGITIHVLNRFGIWFGMDNDAVTPLGYIVLVSLLCLTGGTLTLATYYGLQ